jgi:myo-inositol-1(or 4)-monophosphatase
VDGHHAFSRQVEFRQNRGLRRDFAARAAAMTQPDIAALAAFAGELADAAGRITLAHFRAGGRVDNKARNGAAFDPVTVADREAEAAIRAMIEARHPDHGISGEEHGAKQAGSGYVWHIDPIDGTRSFIIGVPLWGTLIGLEVDERPVVGILDQPHIGERFIGAPDGARLVSARGRTRLATSACTRIGQARLGTTAPQLFAPGEEAERFAEIEARARLTRYGGDCYFYAMLAAGHLDLVVEAGLNSYDIVALIPIIEAAGGVVTTWDGASARRGGRIVAAATAELHAEALRVLGA